jgi:IS5 family transposase
MSGMIRLRYQQPSLWDGQFTAEVGDLWEPWMREADAVLEDEELLDAVLEAQAHRWEHSRDRGRPQTPAEVVLRLLLLKHARNWSFEVLEREVRANLVYRGFCRLGMRAVPDDKTLGGLARAIGPEVIRQLHQRMVELARAEKLVPGRKMRVDTTVVETNIHYPTDSSLLGDGTRVLTRLMQRVAERAEDLGERIRDRMRSVKKKVVAIAISSRRKGAEGEQRRKELYQELLSLTRKVVNQAQRVCAEVSEMPRRRRAAVKPLTSQIQTMMERVRQVMRQTRARIFRGDTKSEDKLASVFEPHTEIIRKGKASKPTEFGKMVKIQEAENQIITDYEVYATRPSDFDVLVESVERHQQRLGRVPDLAAADAAFYTLANEKKLGEMGVKRVSIPNRKTRSEARRKWQKKRWFKKGQRWRTGCEGRISVLKRRHGLGRCLYEGPDGMDRWVGLGVIADNLITIGNLLANSRLSPAT